MKYALTSLLTTLLMVVEAQTLIPDWANALGNGTNVYTKDLEIDEAGNSYLVGYFSGTDVDFSMNSNSSSAIDAIGADDAFLAKYNTNGELLWVHTFGTAVTERLNAIVLTHSGDLLVAGYLGDDSGGTGIDLDPGSGTASVVGQKDALVAKYDTDGNYLDHFVIGGENTAIQEFNDIAVNHGDTIYVAGYSQNPGADMDPGAGTSQLYSNTANADGILGVYEPDFTFIYGRRTQSNKASEFYKLGTDTNGDIYTLIRWGYASGNFDASIIFEYNPTYAAGFGSYTTIGSEDFISGVGYRRGRGINVLKLTKSGGISWNQSIVGGDSDGANKVNDIIGFGDYIYLAGQISNNYFIGNSMKSFGTNGTHGYVLRFNMSNGGGVLDKYLKTTTTTADYVHSIDTSGSNIIVSGQWNGNSTMDLDPGADSYTIAHSNPATYWTELDADLNFVQGGFLASSDGNIGMIEPRLKNLGNNSYLFLGYHDDQATYQESNFGPDVFANGTALAKLTYTPNQAPVILTNLSDTLVGDNTYQLSNVEDLFEDPEGEELTITVSAPFSEDFGVSITGEHPNYTVSVSFLNYVTAPITITATDPFGESTDLSYQVTWVNPSGIRNSYPRDGQSFVPLDATIGFSYETLLETSDLESLIKVNSNFRGVIDGDWTISTDSIIFDPDTTFLPGEMVTVSTLKGVKSSVTGELAIPQRFSFTTATTEAVNDLSYEAFTLGFTGQEVTDAIFADLNADGYLDIIASSHFDRELIYMLSDSLGGFHDAEHVTDSDALSDLHAIDVNNDGHLDIVANSSSTGTYVFYNDGSLTFNRMQVFNGGSQITGFDAADYNLDGLVDFVRSDKYNKNIQVLTQQKDSTFASTTITPTTTIYDMRDVMFGDFTGDGLVDIAWTDGYAVNPGVYLHKQKLDGSFNYQGQVLSNYKATKLYPTDIDQDGDLDIAYSRDQSYGIGVLLNNGSGSFTNKGISDSGNFDTNRITAGDIDSDGDIDLLVTGEYTKKVIVHLNDGEENFIKMEIHTTTAVPNTLGLGDVDGDLDLDILVTTINTGTVTVLENLVVKLLPPTVENSLETLVINEDQSDTLITDQIDTLFSNPEGGEMTYSIASAIDSVTATLDGNSLSLSASYDFNGSTEIYLSATNGIGTTTDTIALTVVAVDDFPIVSASFNDITADEDNLSTTLDMTTAFTEVDREDLVFDFIIISGENLVSIEMIESQLSIIGAADSFGTAKLVIYAQDPQENRISDTLLITINAVNDAPLFEIDRSEITVGRDFTSTEIIAVTDLSLANESDQEINYSLNPASVSFADVTIDAATGEVTITSIAEQFGTQVFTIIADDGESVNSTASEDFTLTVLDNEPPVVETSIEDQVFNEDATERVLAADITTLFSDPEGVTLSITASSDTSDIILEITDNNSLTYEATPDYFGSATITVTANDGSSTTDITFILTITAVNDAPVVANAVADQLATEDLPFSFSLPAGQFSDVDDEDLSLTVDGLPDWVTFDGLALIMHGTPTNEDVGTSTITITADDGELTVTDEFTLTVNNVNDAPDFTTVLQNVTLTEDAGQVILMNLDTVINDIDGDELYLYAEGQQEVATVSISDNNDLVVDVPANVFGSETIYLYAEDAETFIETTFSLTITPVNDAPMFSTDVNELEFQVNDSQIQMISLIPESPVFGEENEEVTYTILQDDNSIIDVTVNGLEVSVLPIGGTGMESFTIQSNDGQLENNIHEVTVQVIVTQVLGEQVQVIQVYPNPTTDRLKVSNIENGHYVVFDQAGSAILNGEITSQGIDVTQLPKGTYTLRLMGGEGGSSLVSRFIKN